jgi:S-adenosylmethionine:tRNA ribosyltransferase-isomerase
MDGAAMIPARAPRADKISARLLVVAADRFSDDTIDSLAQYLLPGDLIVVNDAATLPASLAGRDARGNQIEVRLAAQVNERVWRAVVFGAGDWRTATENRVDPPGLKSGDTVAFAEDFRATLDPENGFSGRLVRIRFDAEPDELLRLIYRYGMPVQYSYMNDQLALWSVQNVYGSRPWAMEMPSAGHALNFQMLLKLAKKGVRIAPLTHAAGLSSTGDPEIDRALPLPEQYEIPSETMDAVIRTRQRRRRVIAVGTSVVRALEGSTPGLKGVTGLKIGAGHRLRYVDGLLTGTHDASESHYQLLRAFVSESVLAAITRHLEEHDYLTHEFGDLCLIFKKGETQQAREL